MSDIDKQRIAAVDLLKSLGFEWVGDKWCHWDGHDHLELAPSGLLSAVRDALNPGHPDNQLALKASRGGPPVICASIPAAIWNRIRDSMGPVD